LLQGKIHFQMQTSHTYILHKQLAGIAQQRIENLKGFFLENKNTMDDKFK